MEFSCARRLERPGNPVISPAILPMVWRCCISTKLNANQNNHFQHASARRKAVENIRRRLPNGYADVVKLRMFLISCSCFPHIKKRSKLQRGRRQHSRYTIFVSRIHRSARPSVRWLQKETLVYWPLSLLQLRRWIAQERIDLCFCTWWLRSSRVEILQGLESPTRENAKKLRIIEYCMIAPSRALAFATRWGKEETTNMATNLTMMILTVVSSVGTFIGS